MTVHLARYRTERINPFVRATCSRCRRDGQTRPASAVLTIEAFIRTSHRREHAHICRGHLRRIRRVHPNGILRLRLPDSA